MRHYAIILSFLTLMPTCCFGHGLDHWSYHDGAEALERWGELEPTCNGKRQSPINIVVDDVKLNSSLGVISLNNYNTVPRNEWKILNDGHSLKMFAEFRENSTPSISLGGLPDEYEFTQLHLHWGSGSNPGSEHLINYKRYPAELHIVHTRKRYAQQPKNNGWMSDSMGLAVVAVLIDIGRDDNKNYAPIINAEKTVAFKDSSSVISGNFSLFQLLPRVADKKKLGFYRYLGSLTTPNCYESVIWTVLQDKVRISSDQYEHLQDLYDVENDVKNKAPQRSSRHVTDNFRPAQKLNGRVVQANRLVYPSSLPESLDNSTVQLLEPTSASAPRVVQNKSFYRVVLLFSVFCLLPRLVAS